MTTTLCSVILEPIGGLGTQAIAMLVLNVEGTKEKKEQGRMKLDEKKEGRKKKEREREERKGRREVSRPSSFSR